MTAAEKSGDYIRNIHPVLLIEARKKGIELIGDQIISPAIVEIEEN